MGRTKGSKNGIFGANIDKAQFEKLCSIMCTEQEICGFFGTSHDTLNRWCHQEYNMTFTEIWEKKSAIGKISLRRIQFQQAEKNPSMAIFLGKQILGQTDNPQQFNGIELEDDLITLSIKNLIGEGNKKDGKRKKQ